MLVIYTIIGLLFLTIFFVVVLKYFKVIRCSFFGIKKEVSDEWSIGIYELYDIDGILQVIPHQGVQNPVLTFQNVTDRNTIITADPFIVYEQSVYYMFFEVVSGAKGVIGLASSKDSVEWNYEKIVLEEPFHLSYPFILQCQGLYYMIPESCNANSIRLYRATKFPYEWQFIKTLVTGRDFVDNTLIYFQSKWWLFTATMVSANLFLYYADYLEGHWYEHPKSPVVTGDKHTARCGGNIIRCKDRLIRIGQDDFGSYGNSVRAFEIEKIDMTNYREKELPESPLLKPAGKSWNSVGMHHLSTVAINNQKWLAAVDGRKFKVNHLFYVKIPNIISQIFK